MMQLRVRRRNSFFTSFFILLLSLVLICQASAGNNFKVINTEQLKTMMDNKVPFVLVDARTKEEYDEAHIAGAISIPVKKFDELQSTLPSDKSSLVVIYCNGVKCGKSRSLAGKAAEAGYSNLMIYGDGFPVWEEKDMKIVAGPAYGKKVEMNVYSPAELDAVIKQHNNDYVLVDVRDESEYKSGHIPTAINIPAESFAIKSEVLPKEKQIIVYCNTGGRSYMAYRKLIKLAYPNIHQTLFANWKDAQMPIER